MVKDSKLFKSYENWIAAYVPDVTLTASVCSAKARNKKEMGLLSNATEKILDPVLVEMLKVYQTVLKSNPLSSIPDKIAEMISKEVKAFEKSDAELTKLLKESYPLASRVEGSFTSIANEVVFYINAKV
jgi:hypothetical protein